MQSPDDTALLEAFAAGDKYAFEALVDHHEAALLRHARSLLASAAEAEDVVQEVFMKLVQRTPELTRRSPNETEHDWRTRANASFAAWLHRVTRNACMDTIRSESRRSAREHIAAPPEATAGGIDAVEAEDTRAAVERGLQRLAQDQREVLALRLLNGKSYREIAEVTGKKVGTVGWLVSVGLKALASDLESLLAGGPAPSPVESEAPRLQGGAS